MTAQASRQRHLARLDRPDDFDAWRTVARALLMAGVPPDGVGWSAPGEAAGDLFAAAGALPAGRPDLAPPVVPRQFLTIAQQAILHSTPGRFDDLYRLLWLLQRERALMDDSTRPEVRRVGRLAREVRRDLHKMRAFLRFRSLAAPDGSAHYVAWFEPDHHILRANAAFFVNRFASLRWSILTPRGTLHWDGDRLREGPPAQRQDAPAGDPVEQLWRDYYGAIFNPARLKVGAMLKEMPRRYWRNMPETMLIPELVATARSKELAMVAKGADPFAGVDRPDDLEHLSGALQQCRRCPIGCNGTRAVAGEGPAGAALMIVGEQPGDVEEREGRPFVGPAGQLLMQQMEAAGIDRRRTFVTNAVKHFKFSPRGKRRIHETPTAREIDICRWWLESERRLVRPRLILALGASAARGVLGRTVSVSAMRSQWHALEDGTALWISTHPSYLLRLRDEKQAMETARFAEDLHAVEKRLNAA